jgi:hypothetical protein
MDAGILIPLGCFAAVILIVALISTSRIRNTEVETQRLLYDEEMRHQQMMRELELKLEKMRNEQAGAAR